MAKILDKDNDNIVRLNEIKNNATSEYVNSSSNVTARLTTLAGVQVVAAQSLTYIAGSDGNYDSTWDTSLLSNVALGRYYLEYVVAEGGLDLLLKVTTLVEERIVGTGGVLGKDNDNIVKLLGIYNNRSKLYLNNSSNVTAKLIEMDGTEVFTARTLSFVSGSNGDYQDIWDKSLLTGVARGRYRILYSVSEAGVDLMIKQPVYIDDRIAA